MNRPIRSLKTLRNLLELTDNMIKAAQSGHWETVSELDARRVKLLELPEELVDTDDDSQQRLRQLIKAADARLLADITGRREKMAEASMHQRSRSTAVRGYRDAQALQSPVTD